MAGGATSSGCACTSSARSGGTSSPTRAACAAAIACPRVCPPPSRARNSLPRANQQPLHFLPGLRVLFSCASSSPSLCSGLPTRYGAVLRKRVRHRRRQPHLPIPWRRGPVEPAAVRLRCGGSTDAVWPAREYAGSTPECPVALPVEYAIGYAVQHAVEYAVEYRCCASMLHCAAGLGRRVRPRPCRRCRQRSRTPLPRAHARMHKHRHTAAHV